MSVHAAVGRGVNPPLPLPSSSADGSGGDTTLSGQRLLSLVKTALQKKKQQQIDDDDDDDGEDGEDGAVNVNHNESNNKTVKATAAASTAVDEAIACLENLIAQTSRRGLLQGNVGLAEQVLLATSSSSRNPNNNNNSYNNSNGGKRKRDKGRNNNAASSSSLSSGLVIYADDFKQGEGGALTGGGSTAATGTSCTTSTSTTTLDVNLILSAILRILGSGNSGQKQQQQQQQQQQSSCSASTIISPGDVHLLVTMAADLCTAISEYIQTVSSQHSNNRVVVLAEYELLAASAKQILTGLSSCTMMQGILSQQQEHQGHVVVDAHEEEQAIALMKSCLRAAASLIALFGTKLTRSVGILQQLGKVAWQVILLLSSTYDDRVTVVDAATMLLSSLPLAGGLDRVTPSQLWTTCFNNILQMLLELLQAVVPVGQRLGNKIATSNNSTSRLTDETFKSVLDNMLINIASVPDHSQQEQRVALFLRYTHALCRLTCHYLSRQQQVALRQVDVATFLDLVDIFLSFPMAAEAAYYGTKKRLRYESTAVHGGLLNITMIATHVANPLKLYGFQLLNALVDAMGGPLLLPFACRLTRTCHAALLTSASSTVRSVLDPSSAGAASSSGYSNRNSNNSNNNNKRRRWLNASIVVRTAGLQSLCHIVQTFGAIDESKNKNIANVGAVAVGSHHRIASETDRAIALVAACLVEQVQLATQDEQHQQQQLQDEWGTLHERVELVIQAVKCLQAYLLSHSGGGAFLSMEARSLVESVTESCLTKLIFPSCCTSSSGSSPVLGFTAIQASFLSLGTSCVCTAWPDGGSSALQGLLCDAAGTCKYRSSSQVDNDNRNNNELVEAASTALRLCESLANPRVPAIQIVTRQQQQSMPTGGSGGGGGGRMVTQASELARRLEQAHGESKRLDDEETARDEARRSRQKEKGPSSKKTKTARAEATPRALPETKAKHQTTSTSNGSTVDRNGQEQPTSPTVAVKLSDSYQTRAKEDDKLRNLSSNKDGVTTTTRSTTKHQDKEDDNVDGGEGEDDFPMIMNVGPDEDDK